ncbi:MAG: AAA family ATPase [Chromatiaceae bacterium]
MIMTGVTKFSKVSLFSGLNQLEDLVYSPSDWC